MSFNRILKLLSKELTEAELDELEALSDQRRQEQKNAIPRPSCCHEAQRYPAVIFSVDIYSGDSALAPGKWSLSGLGHTIDHLGGSLEDLRTLPEPSYCPFCGTPLPKMVRKDPVPPHICHVTDGGYYCDTCKQRLNACICDPPEAAFEFEVEPEQDLKTLREVPKLDEMTDET